MPNSIIAIRAEFLHQIPSTLNIGKLEVSRGLAGLPEDKEISLESMKSI